MERIIKYNRHFIASIALVMAVLLGGCDETVYVEESNDGPPTIDTFSPLTGNNGTLINLKGEFLRHVDSAAFGDGVAVIHRVINSNEIVLKVTNASKSGKITLKSPTGIIASNEDFTMEYITPVGSEWPTEGVINQDVSVLGENLQAITKVTFQSLGSTEVYEGVISYQSSTELAVQVPYVEANWAIVENVRSTITLYYNSETEEKSFSSSAYSFSAQKPEFEVTNWPTAVLKNSEVNIIGVNINLADSVFFGDFAAEIVKATPISITVLVPNVSERDFLNMRIVYFKTLEVENDVKTEVYTKYRKTLANFEGGISSMIVRTDRVSAGVNTVLAQASTDPLPAPEGKYYFSYLSDADAINKSSVPLYFLYSEGEDNKINLDAFSDPVLHFYYYNDSTPSYLQLELNMSGTNMRQYIERYRTNHTGWELVCIRLADAQFGTGYDGPFGVIDYKNSIDEIHINYKPAENDETLFCIDNVFISEGALKGAIDLTKHTKEFDFEIDIVD